jgi:DNA-binding HxlR family transcriptional regulator
MTSAPKAARRHTEVTKAHAPPHGASQAGAPSGCVAVREVLNLVGDKWSVLVVGTLGGGSRRFSEIKRSIEGISQRMLTLTLRGLERDGMLTRSVTPTIPPRVDYELTKLGLTLLDPVRALAKWAERNRTAIQASRDRFDRAATLRRDSPGSELQRGISRTKRPAVTS